MSRDDKFFQFPVAALQIGKPITEVTDSEMSARCYEVMNYSMIAAGYKVNEELREDIAVNHPEYESDIPDWTMALLAGAQRIGVTVSSITSPNRLASYRKFNVSNSKQLRLRKDLLFGFAELTTDMTWREFSVLCGVYAGVGAHSFVRLSFDYIAILAAGYSSKAQATQARAKLLKRHEVRYTVSKLAERGLFAMVAPNRRHNVYSVSLNAMALADQILARVSNQVKRDSSTISKILQQKLAELKRTNSN